MVVGVSRRWGAILSLHLAGLIFRSVIKLYPQHAISKFLLRAGLTATRRLETVAIWFAFGGRRGLNRRASTREITDRVD